MMISVAAKDQRHPNEGTALVKFTYRLVRAIGQD
jgi:hypothetical protein